MNKEEIKDLIEYMWKDELSKSGKWALEEYIKDLQKKLSSIEASCEEVIIDDEKDHDCCEEEKHYFALNLLEILKGDDKDVS